MFNFRSFTWNDLRGRDRKTGVRYKWAATDLSRAWAKAREVATCQRADGTRFDFEDRAAGEATIRLSWVTTTTRNLSKIFAGLGKSF